MGNCLVIHAELQVCILKKKLAIQNVTGKAKKIAFFLNLDSPSPSFFFFYQDLTLDAFARVVGKLKNCLASKQELSLNRLLLSV